MLSELSTYFAIYLGNYSKSCTCGKRYFTGLRLTVHQKSELELYVKLCLGLGLEIGLGVRFRVWERVSIRNIVQFVT